MIRIKSTIATISIIAVWTLASQVQADEYKHIDEMALRIQLKSTELYKEMQHYRHTPQYRHVRQDALELKRLARDIHRIAHAEGSIFELEACLDELDHSFHHTAELVDQIEFEAAHRYGQVNGRTGHVKDLMVDLEDCLHHMQRDVRNIRQYSVRNVHRTSRPVYIPQGYVRRPETGRPIFADGRSGGHGYLPGFNSSGTRSHGFNGIDRDGITFGNGNFKVRFNF